MINFDYTIEFERDFKKLSKKFRTLKEDLETAQKNAIELKHIHNIDNGSIVEIQNFNETNIKFYKLRKFACKSLKGKGVKSGIRITYAYHMTEKKIVYIEVYFKGNKENADLSRLAKYKEIYGNT